MKTYRPWAPKQSFLLPPCPHEWLPEDHLAYFVLDVVEQLDLRAIEEPVAAKDPRGEKPYSPRMLVALLVYGYAVGVFSSRRIARATYEDVAFRVLAAGAHPHFTTVNQFRLDHLGALAGLFVQVLRLCQKAGLVKLGQIALDGTKLLANASKHKAQSYDRMKKDEQRLRAEVEALLRRANTTDEREDAQYGPTGEPEDIPAELRRREDRLAKILAAKVALEAEARVVRAAELREKARAQRARSSDENIDATERKRAATRAVKSEERAKDLDGRDDDPPPSTGDLPSHRVSTTADGAPKGSAQRNFTDPDSRIMLKHGAFVQAYNAQAVVTEDQVVIASAVTNQAPDVEHFIPLMKRAVTNTGKPEKLLADSGYLSEENLAFCEATGVEAYISVGRQQHGITEPGAKEQPSVRKQALVEKLRTPEDKQVYSRRKVIPEPVFGQIQHARGFRRFSLRGLHKVNLEWSLVTLVHNLLKLFRTCRFPQPLVLAE